MPSLPPHDGKFILSPHVVLLGAGASVAAFPDGDLNGKRLPLMNDLIHKLELTSLLQGYDIKLGENFEAFYDGLVSSGQNKEVIAEIERRVSGYFFDLQLPPSPTIYDYLVLSLREKDLIATFNWDPFLLQAFRRNLHLKKLPQLAFLHGNVALGICYEDLRCGYVDQRCGICGRMFNSSKLLYPVRHKNYTDDTFIKGEWDRLRDILENAYYFTIFGYSAPATDLEAKELMIEVWQKNTSLEIAEIDLVDIKQREELEETWRGFTYSHHYGVYRDIFNSYLFRHPRRSCEAFFDATMMCRPWKENPFPTFNTLTELQEWVLPLVQDEEEVDL
jgi:hypothetical protein